MVSEPSSSLPVAVIILSMAYINKVPMLSNEEFDDWKIRVQAHLSALDDDMWYVIIDGPIKILKNGSTSTTAEAHEKPRSEWTTEERKKANLDNVAKDILYKTLDKNTFSKIRECTTAKEIWEKLIKLCEGNAQTKENKLMVATQKFDNIKMKTGETMTQFDERFSAIVNELSMLGKSYTNREKAIKVMRALPREWDIKTMAMRESKDLNSLELHDLFSDLKAYEFEMNSRNEAEPSSSAVTAALVTKEVAAPQAEKPVATPEQKEAAKQISDEMMSLFVKRFGKFMRRNNSNPNSNFKSNFDRNPTDKTMKCFNCDRPGHFAADCRKPKADRKKEEKKPFNKKSYKGKEKVLLAEDSKRKWAYSESDSSDESSDEEVITCLMANGDNDEVTFDCSSNEFTRDELENALEEMFFEYKKISNLLKEKEKELDVNKSEFDNLTSENSTLKEDKTKMLNEIDELKISTEKLTTENLRLNYIVESWTTAGKTLQQIHNQQRPANCKTGLGYEEGSKPKENLIKKFVKFVKTGSAEIAAETVVEEKIKYIPPVTNVTWLKAKQIDSAKRPKSKKLNQQQRNKVKNSKVSDSRPKSAHKIQSTSGKPVKIIQVWVPKGIINKGPKNSWVPKVSACAGTTEPKIRR